MIVNLDKLTYAGNLDNLRDVENLPNYRFEKGDINDAPLWKAFLTGFRFDAVIHLAAESHVDRSISGPMEFISTNIIGTVNLLNAAKKQWEGNTQANCSIIYQPTRSMAHWEVKGLFTEKPPMIPAAPTRLQKPVPTTWSGPGTIPINCRL
jgi:dTDP-glucose 4,6-dehydratase